ncbi:hypothetical protein [Paenibacillus rhizophilus]|uniref:Uncharacterized protein n=1 Tax=Paenibacillus rhizophilus TaxID=1850366 RepID=A0A3N9PFF7_9BACL|nr:hypothetical protein [Paenibacillus rhizophilus]RQW13774.1 hypothetical protein EH198_05110 [Paenibacillus rhizophilus]
MVLLAVGGVAVGKIALGGLAVGKIAIGGSVIGKYTLSAADPRGILAGAVPQDAGGSLPACGWLAPQVNIIAVWPMKEIEPPLSPL